MALQLNPITGKLDLVGAGGSTSPGGAPGQLQFNSAGSFGGATTGAGVLTALGNAAGAANGFALLDGSGKITAAQLPAAVLGAMNYQGVWNANTNSPALASGVGSKGYYYKIGTAGLTSIDGLAQWNVGDLIVFNGSTWDKIDGVPSEVISVAGRTGAVTLSHADISDLGTAALVNTGTSGATIPLLNAANTFSANQTIAEVAGGSALTLTGATQTTNNPLILGSQTWNAAGVTFTGLKLSITDTASAAGSLLLDLQVGGASKFKVDKSGVATFGGTLAFANQSATQIASLYFGGSNDVILSRDAANTLALRNGANAQTFNVYNTYTDASNYERGIFSWGVAANRLTIGAVAAGTGSIRPVDLYGNGIQFKSRSGSLAWEMDSSGNLIASGSDNAYDIGASGANRPRNGYFANNITVGGTVQAAGVAIGNNVTIPAGNGVLWSGRAAVSSPADGIVKILQAGSVGYGIIVTTATTVASLPAAATAGAGARAFVTDALGPTFGAIVVGGGAVAICVYSDASNWKVG